MFGGALVGAVLVLHAGATWSLGVAAGIVTATAVFFSREAPLELGLALAVTRRPVRRPSDRPPVLQVETARLGRQGRTDPRAAAGR